MVLCCANCPPLLGHWWVGWLDGLLFIFLQRSFLICVKNQKQMRYVPLDVTQYDFQLGVHCFAYNTTFHVY